MFISESSSRKTPRIRAPAVSGLDDRSLPAICTISPSASTASASCSSPRKSDEVTVISWRGVARGCLSAHERGEFENRQHASLNTYNTQHGFRSVWQGRRFPPSYDSRNFIGVDSELNGTRSYELQLADSSIRTRFVERRLQVVDCFVVHRRSISGKPSRAF